MRDYLCVCPELQVIPSARPSAARCDAIGFISRGGASFSVFFRRDSLLSSINVAILSNEALHYPHTYLTRCAWVTERHASLLGGTTNAPLPPPTFLDSLFTPSPSFELPPSLSLPSTPTPKEEILA
eukprot:Hpha_TRINITY_DN15806_c1_g7::TRINITY_DN15806_c1_g7_i1::g.188286::m.188286